jgi:two-component system response regulator CpxR
MSVIALFSAAYCYADEVARAVTARLDYELLTHEDLLQRAAQGFDLPAAKLERALWGQRPVFNRLTHEKERCIARIRAVLAERIAADRVLVVGPAGHLIPQALAHVLRVCLIAKFDHRVAIASETDGVPAKTAERLLHKLDEQWRNWTLHLFGLGPWDTRLHDVLLPMDSIAPAKAVDLICESAARAAVQSTARTRQAASDFVLASRVQLALANHGHDVEVRVEDAKATIVINRYVARLERFKEQLARLAGEVSGVDEVQTKLGPHFKQPDIYPSLDEFELPPKILLVDDEEEFVLTLSERLAARNLESAVAHDGEQALSIVETEAPDVMVLDLKMPGIDGLEVLRRVKRERPQTEVIILTGHGSEREEAEALALGAYAYLNKPVDVDRLAEIMRGAYQAARLAGSQGGSGGDGHS